MVIESFSAPTQHMFLLSSVIILQSVTSLLQKKIVASQKTNTCHQDMPSFVSSCKLYAPQTKILEVRTNRWERIFVVLFKCVSTRFGRHPFEKLFEKIFPTVRSDFQNLRLGDINLLQKIIASSTHAIIIFCIINILEKTPAHRIIASHAIIFCTTDGRIAYDVRSGESISEA